MWILSSTRKRVRWSGEGIIPLYTTRMRSCLGVVSNSAPTPKCQKAAASPVEEPLTKLGRRIIEPGKRRLRHDLIAISPHLKEIGNYGNRARPLSEVHRVKQEITDSHATREGYIRKKNPLWSDMNR